MARCGGPGFPGDCPLCPGDFPFMVPPPMKSTLFALLPAVALLGSCAQQSLSGDVYSRGEARQGQSVQTGRITALRPVKIEGNTEAGSLLGTIAGGVLGSNIGGGRAANTAGAIGGAIVGGAVASHAQKAMGTRNGLEITVKLDSGSSVAVVQEVDPRNGAPFSIGDRVRVISSGGAMRVAY